MIQNHKSVEMVPLYPEDNVIIAVYLPQITIKV